MMMEFETWKREELINEVKTAMILAASKPHGDFLGMPITIKFHTNKELSQKTDYELRCIYVEYKMHDDDFRQQYEENEERKRFFNQPTANADIDYWSKQAYWSIDEAIALILGKDPRKVTWKNLEPYLSTSPFAMKFHELRELAKRYVNCKELFDPVFPSVFLAWAKRMSINIPGELVNAVSAIGIQIADWKGHYEKIVELYNQREKQCTEPIDLLGKKDSIINELKTSIEQLKENQNTKNTQLSQRAENGYKNIIASLLEYISGETPTIDKHPNYVNQTKLIETLAEQYNGYDGMSQSNLSRKLPDTRKHLSKQS